MPDGAFQVSLSRFPDFCPQTFDLDYIGENKILVVDYQLPEMRDLPTLSEVKYAQARGEFVEKHLPEAKIKALYDHVLYQIAFRTIHELFEADRVNALSAVVFNGYVTTLDPTSGHELSACLLSLQVTRESFQRINLTNINLKACFRSLGGIAAAYLHSLTPVAPVLKLNREHAQFVDAQGVMGELQSGDNLAAMPWEEFAHLIWELFELEFSAVEGVVKVTRASSDDGVDAVVFDPDPLRGGKIIIQAKRYIDTVEVSVVRDLYETVMNEGANKGILVTTSTFGADAYEFVQSKPLVLLSGSELLHLLEKHGRKARIDLHEASRLAAEN